MLTLDLINKLFPSTNLIEEKQNQDYEGLFFQSKNLSYRSRLGKKTDKKKGYFVVFWEKDEINNNKSYSIDNAPDYYLIWIIDNNQIGFFKFPKKILLENKILSDGNQKGKMGIRVYPSWCTNLNSTAKQTKNWQIPYFSLCCKL